MIKLSTSVCIKHRRGQVKLTTHIAIYTMETLPWTCLFLIVLSYTPEYLLIAIEWIAIACIVRLSGTGVCARVCVCGVVRVLINNEVLFKKYTYIYRGKAGGSFNDLTLTLLHLSASHQDRD